MADKEALETGGFANLIAKVKAWAQGLFAPKSQAIKDITRSGATFTATRADDTTFTFDQQVGGGVTGVKGNAETDYRTGDVNLSPSHVGAKALADNWTHEAKIVNTDFYTWVQTSANIHHNGNEDVTYARFFITDGTTPSDYNLPCADQHIIIHSIDNGTAWIRCIAFDIITNNVYVNGRVNNTWQGWSIVARGSFLPLSGGTMTGALTLNAGAIWKAGTNITCPPTANGQEWSFDVGNSSYTGSYWHVWSGRLSKTILACYSDDCHVTIPNGYLDLNGHQLANPDRIEFKPTANNSGNGGYIDFHYNQSTADYTSRIIEDASGRLTVNGRIRISSSRNYGGTSYIAGCGGAAGLVSEHTTKDEWYAALNIRTKSQGGWAIGSYNDDNLQFAFGTKANIDSGNNSCNIVVMRPISGTLATTAEVANAGNLTTGTIPDARLSAVNTTGSRNTSNTTGGSINICKRGKMVDIQFNLNTKAVADALVGTIPAGYRPAHEAYALVTYAANRYYVLHPNGNINFIGNVAGIQYAQTSYAIG